LWSDGKRGRPHNAVPFVFKREQPKGSAAEESREMKENSIVIINPAQNLQAERENLLRRRFQTGSIVRRGKSWEFRWREYGYDEQGQRCHVNRREVFASVTDYPTKRLALRHPFIAQKQNEINNTTLRPVRAINFAQFAERWKAQVLTQHKPSTQVAAKSHIKIHFNPSFGHLPLSQINGERLQAFVASRKVGPKSIANLIATLRMMWNSAEAWGHVNTDPFEGLVLPQVPDPEVGCFTTEEIKTILSNAPEPDGTFYWLAAEAGMRAGELCGLRWEHIDLDNGIIVVRQSAWQGRIVTPKTKKACRTFAISPQLLEHLRSNAGKGLLFSYRNGRPWKGEKVVERKLGPLLKKLGIPHRGLHAFRHGNATIMDRLNAPMKARQDRLGHTDLRMTGRYTHVLSEDDRRIAWQIGQLLCPTVSKNNEAAEVISFNGPVSNQLQPAAT
jgi:integrase